MIRKDSTRITITLSESMYGELMFMSSEKKVTKSAIIEALCMSYFWRNNKLLEMIVKGDQHDKSKK